MTIFGSELKYAKLWAYRMICCVHCQFESNELIIDYISNFQWSKIQNLEDGLVMRCIFHFVYLYNVCDDARKIK